MATMTFKMDNQKKLICTTNATIYQNENCVDTISFLFPLKYDEYDIGDGIVAIEYMDPTSVTHVEVLKRDEEIYNEQYYRYTFPISSEFTKIAGRVNFVIEIIMTGENDLKQILRVGSAAVTVLKWNDYMSYLPDEELSPMEKRVQIIEDLAKEP